jgi:hypothetical protein
MDHKQAKRHNPRNRTTGDIQRYRKEREKQTSNDRATEKVTPT